MSMILKGIDLPKKDKSLYIRIFNEEIEIVHMLDAYEVEHTNAQAIQIPKNHGNLKDIDAIYRAFSRCAENEADDGKIRVYAQLMRLILQAPTILESEENDERNT